jgi:hypothetical protein
VKFTVEQRFAAQPDAVAHAYADPALYDLLGELPKLGAPQVLDHAVDGTTVTLAIRYRFTGELSSAARAVLDPNKLTWVERSTHDLASRRVTYRLDPDSYVDRFSSSGAYEFIAAGDGALRRASGEVNVKALIVGGRVEGAIVSGLREHLAAEVPVVERYIADRA